MSEQAPEARLLKDLVESASFRRVIADLLDELAGVVDTPMLERFAGGTLRFIPKGEHQPKDVPVEAFFKKLTAVREKLRVLEQKLNNHPMLTEEDKADLQQYLTRAYGSLTTFNFLFKNKEDGFKGSGS